jgi:hypothetical protein
MTWPYDCPHVSGERGAAWCRLLVAAGCPVYWRTGVCAVCLGEWGAWRALGDHAMCDKYSSGSWQSFRVWNTLSAVGWSP